MSEITTAGATETYLRASEVATLAQDIADQMIAAKIAATKRAEDVRANRRNRNSSLTILISLMMGFAGPTLLPMIGIPLAYSFCAIIVPDAIVRAWAFIKRY